MSQKARAALKYISGVGAEPRPPRFGPSSQANVMWPVPARLTVATFRNGVTDVTSASKTISRRVIGGPSPSGVALIVASWWRRRLEWCRRIEQPHGRTDDGVGENGHPTTGR